VKFSTVLPALLTLVNVFILGFASVYRSIVSKVFVLFVIMVFFSLYKKVLIFDFDDEEKTSLKNSKKDFRLSIIFFT
jgi:hypothetical protein